MDFRVWSFILLILMVVTIILELLTPSMGGFTLAALGCAGASIWAAFKYSDSFGYIMAAINLILFPLSLWIGIRVIKKSPLMHDTAISTGSQSAPDATPLAQLTGQQGRTLTPLRPAGAALFGAMRVDVVTESKWVEADTAVKVLRVEGNRVVVEPLETKMADAKPNTDFAV